MAGVGAKGIQQVQAQASAVFRGEDDTRALLRRVFVTPGNLRPDYDQKTLLVELHRLGSPLQDAAVAKFCEELTATETRFPTTDLRLIYRQVGSA